MRNIRRFRTLAPEQNGGRNASLTLRGRLVDRFRKARFTARFGRRDERFPVRAAAARQPARDLPGAGTVHSIRAR